jgi:hypothetical protein
MYYYRLQNKLGLKKTFVIACGSVVVETLGYKPGGLGLETG